MDLPTKPTRIILADDHRMVRAGLAVLLRSVPGMEIVGEADDGRSAVKLAAQLLPDVVVMDISMPDLNGIEATRQICAGGTGTKVIGLSAYSNPHFMSEMLRAGASAFILKDAAFAELRAAVNAAVSPVDHAEIPVGISAPKRMDGWSLADEPSAFTRLTSREREVLQLMAEGKATKEIANHLEVSVKTVETHRRKLMEKLGIDTVAELTKYAIREGLTSID